MSKTEQRNVKKVLKRIERASKKGKTSIRISSYYSNKVYKALENKGLGIQTYGSWDSMWNTVCWDNE